MSIARRIGVALAIAGAVATPASAAPQRSSPGYSYRLTITGRVTEPSGRSTDYLVMSGHALVTEKAGRLDVDQASSKRGAVADKDDYILYDSASMTIVAPRARQMVRLSLANLDRALSPATTPAATIGDVAVDLAKLGAGEPILGMATTKYRLTRNYTIATTIASVKRTSAEHVVEEVWMADEKKDVVNPFARLGEIHAGTGSGVDELLSRTAEARSRMGRGIPLRIVTTTTSTSSRNAVTQTVRWMEVSELQAENVDDDILAAPTDYQMVDVNALARTAQTAQGTKSGAPAKVARPASTDNAAAEAKGEFVKELHSMGRRP